jgi:oxalate decarboxylase
VLDPSGQTEINNYGPGDLWFFPKGHGHSIQTIGDEPCHFILSFDNGAFSEHGTFLITDWVDVTPKDMLAKNFGLPAEAFASFPKGETYIQAGPVHPASKAIDAPWPKESTHKFRLLADARARRDFDGGTFNLATVDEWPVSKTMAGGLIVIKPSLIKELHWRPNARTAPDRRAPARVPDCPWARARDGAGDKYRADCEVAHIFCEAPLRYW